MGPVLRQSQHLPEGGVKTLFKQCSDGVQTVFGSILSSVLAPPAAGCLPNDSELLPCHNNGTPLGRRSLPAYIHAINRALRTDVDV